MTRATNELRTAEILLEVRIHAPRQRVWDALVGDLSPWWHPAFFTNQEKGRAFRLDERLGGHLFEDWGEGQGLVWGTVIGIDRGALLQLVGDSSKEWGGPSRAFHTYRLREDGADTLLRFESVHFGRVSEAAASSMESGWRFLFGRCLKQYVETGSIDGIEWTGDGC